jgi:hypothetical protein
MTRVELMALLGALAWLALVLEMVRRRRFSEGYALLWLLAGLALLILSFWRELLEVLARAVGIFYPPTALFVLAFGFVLLIIVQQSAMICELERRNTDLEQRLTILALQVECWQAQQPPLGQTARSLPYHDATVGKGDAP